MTIEHIHLSQQAKDQLVRLKRATGLTTWNALCRWALCISLAEAGIPPPKKIPADSNVEMSWRVFAGTDGDVYLALLRERCIRDGLSPGSDTLTEQFRLHLHRGIAYLAANKRVTGIDGLVALAIDHRHGSGAHSPHRPSKSRVAPHADDLFGGTTKESGTPTPPAGKSPMRQP